jgi:surface antigen
MRKQARLVSFTLMAAMFAGGVFAEPPAHAPAHGWRKKNDPEYVGYTGTRWVRDYDVASGRCNREEIGAVLGGAVGGAIGARTSSEENRVVGTILGAAVGALIGSRIGRELDDGDRGCFGHTLELAKPGQQVEWVNSRTGVSYSLVPGAGKNHGGKTCRTFVLHAKRGDKKDERRGSACQVGPGEWNLS